MTFEELAQELRQARLSKRWRPRDIARKTRIQYEYIKKIEEGDFSFMPDPVIRGFIKSYARDVGLNQREIIAKYDQARSLVSEKVAEEKAGPEESPAAMKRKAKPSKKMKEKPPPSKQPSPQIELPLGTGEKIDAKLPGDVSLSEARPEAGPSREPTISGSEPGSVSKSMVEIRKAESPLRKYRGEIMLGFLSLVIVAGIVLVYFQFATDFFSKPEEPIKRISVFEARKQNLAKKPRVTKILPPPRPKEVTLRILAAERTWVRLITDEIDTAEFIFSPGSTRSFKARNRFELKMGRADGLYLWVNEDSVGILGTAGEIVDRLIITDQGIVNKVVRHPLPSRSAKPDTSQNQESGPPIEGLNPS